MTAVAHEALSSAALVALAAAVLAEADLTTGLPLTTPALAHATTLAPQFVTPPALSEVSMADATSTTARVIESAGQQDVADDALALRMSFNISARPVPAMNLPSPIQPSLDPVNGRVQVAPSMVALVPKALRK